MHGAVLKVLYLHGNHCFELVLVRRGQVVDQISVVDVFLALLMFRVGQLGRQRRIKRLGQQNKLELNLFFLSSLKLIIIQKRLGRGKCLPSFLARHLLHWLPLTGLLSPTDHPFKNLIKFNCNNYN